MILNADALHIPLANNCVQMVCTSPPYYGLRDYGVAGQLGLEPTPEEYVANLVSVFREVWRDSYAGGNGNGGIGPASKKQVSNHGSYIGPIIRSKRNSPRWGGGNVPASGNLKVKDLIGIPWMIAFALRADGWYLRSDIIWAKPNPMPESVQDRPTRSHEYLFLLTKSAKYYYDAEAIKEPCKWSSLERLSQNIENQEGSTRANGGLKTNGNMKAVGGNKKMVEVHILGKSGIH